MVHIHQILVHERIVAIHRTAETARLVLLVAIRSRTRAAAVLRPTRHRRETRKSGLRLRGTDKNARHWAAGRGPDTARRCRCPSSRRSSRDSRSGSTRRPPRPDATAPGDARSGLRARTPCRTPCAPARSARPRTSHHASCPASPHATTRADTSNQGEYLTRRRSRTGASLAA